jgi:hypothetical protein
MNELHTVEVRFRGEMLATYIDLSGAYTIYRTPERLYRIHIDEGEGGLAWLESGRNGSGLTAAQVRTLFPEFEPATNIPTPGNVHVKFRPRSYSRARRRSHRVVHESLGQQGARGSSLPAGRDLLAAPSVGGGTPGFSSRARSRAALNGTLV